MVAPASTSTQQPQAAAQHQYGTRIRSNSAIKPSIRLRHSASSAAPTPRRIKPVPTPKAKHASVTPAVPQPEYPHFPLDHVMLHHDDANSKVFIAIGRSFMSVDNRAMTIKDLSEMTMKYGIMCQNVSAAGQAITTYIRAHLQRCEVQQDHPLLLRHVLSGTASDDDLLPALHSRTGGAHCALNPSDNRVTNFRRGTMVWYLSRAAGAPCPFARCGIRLCDYNELGKVDAMSAHSGDKKREKDRLRRVEQCGQKRKRLLRSRYADKGSDSDSMSEEEKPPPKVKLTLRLRPLRASSSGASLSASPAPQDTTITAGQSHTHSSPEIIDLSKDDTESSESEEDSEDDSMSVDSSASSDADEGSPAPAQSGDSLSLSTHGAHPTFSASPGDCRRSTSASPPPDSEDDDDVDYHADMTTFRRYSFDRYSSWDDEDEDEMNLDDKFWDFDNDTDTQWESPGPRSPSAQIESSIVVKQELSDISDSLDIWDDLDSKGDPKVVDVVLRAAAGLDTDYMQPKLEELDPWEMSYFASTSSDSFAAYPIGDLASRIKEEEVESGISFLSRELRTPPPEHPLLRPSSPISPIAPSESPSTSLVAERRASHLIWRDAEILGPDSLKPHDLAEGEWRDGCRSTDVASPAASHAVASALAYTGAPVVGTTQVAQQARVGLPPPRLDLAAPGRREQGYLVPDLSSPSLLSSLTSLSIHTPTSPDVSMTGPSLSAPQGNAAGLPASRPPIWPVQDEEPRTVHPCQPCDPNIVATQMEGVSVYQMTLGSSLILRRVDTGFVHVDPLLKELGLPSSSSPPPNTICITMGSPQVCGTWLPLPAARELCKNHPTVAVFLSDQLPDCFPSAIQELTRHAHPFGRWHSSFGQHFKSTIDAKRDSLSTQQLDFAADEHNLSPLEREEQFLSMQQSALALTHAILPTPATSPEEHLVPELPLSPAEEKMFRELCTDPEWESMPSPPGSAALEHGDAPVEAPPAGPSASAKGKERPCQERPLRRSKRVADAIANRSRTRSSKRGSRSSLS